MTDEFPPFRLMYKTAKENGIYRLQTEMSHFVKIAHPVQMDNRGRYVLTPDELREHQVASAINFAEERGDVAEADKLRLDYAKRTGNSDEYLIENNPESKMFRRVDENGRTPIDTSKGLLDFMDHGYVVRDGKKIREDYTRPDEVKPEPSKEIPTYLNPKASGKKMRLPEPKDMPSDMPELKMTPLEGPYRDVMLLGKPHRRYYIYNPKDDMNTVVHSLPHINSFYSEDGTFHKPRRGKKSYYDADDMKFINDNNLWDTEGYEGGDE